MPTHASVRIMTPRGMVLRACRWRLWTTLGVIAPALARGDDSGRPRAKREISRVESLTRQAFLDDEGLRQIPHRAQSLSIPIHYSPRFTAFACSHRAIRTCHRNEL